MECAEARSHLLARRRGTLVNDTHARVDEHVASCARCTADADADAELDRALERLPPRAAPHALRARLRARWTPPARSKMSVRLAVGAALLAAALAVALFVRRSPEAMTVESVNDHLRVLYADRPLEIASGGIHQVKPWFAGRLDFAPVIAFDGDADYPLEGGAVGYFVDRKAAVFVYQRRLHRISLLVFRADGLPWPVATTPLGGVRAHVEESRGFHVVLFRKGDLGYALVSDLNRTELLALAARVAGD